jgi:hypothetical protein
MLDLSTVKSGDLLACSGNDLFGRGVRIFTGSKWSHVATFVTLTDLSNQLFVIESREPNGVRLVPAHFYDSYDGEVWAATVKGYDDAVSRVALLQVYFPQLGAPYDTTEIEELIRHCTGVPISRTKFICSVLVDWAWTQIGYPLVPDALVAPSTVMASTQLTNIRQLK